MNTFASRAAITLAVGMIGLAAYATGDDIVLKLKPKVGDAYEYKASATFETDQGTLTFNQKHADKVTDVKADGGFVVKSSSSETKITFGGQELPGGNETVSTSEYGPDGLLKAITADPAPDASAYRIANLHGFKIPTGPVKIGDEIKFDIAADKTKGTPTVNAVYKVAGLEKVGDWDTVKLTFTAQEPDSDLKSAVKGTAWLNAADGSIVKMVEEWKNVQPNGSPFPLNGKYTVERTK